MEEHMVSVNIVTDEEGLQFKVTLRSELPVFKYKYGGHPDYGSITEYRKEKSFSVNPKRTNKRLKRELLKAQKRYKKIVAVRNTQFPYNTRFDLTSKL